MEHTEHSIGTFLVDSLEHVHTSVHVMTTLGVIAPVVTPDRIQQPTVWGFILAINWFVAVAVVYTFIALMVTTILALLVSDFAFRDKNSPRRKAFADRAPVTILVFATIVGIVIAILSKGVPGKHDEMAGVILFRLIGFIAMGFSLLVLIGAIGSAFERKPTVK